MPSSRNFDEPGDHAAVGDDVVLHGDDGNLVGGIAADGCHRRVGVSPCCLLNLRRVKVATTRPPRSGQATKDTAKKYSRAVRCGVHGAREKTRISPMCKAKPINAPCTNAAAV